MFHVQCVHWKAFHCTVDVKLNKCILYFRVLYSPVETEEGNEWEISLRIKFRVFWDVAPCSHVEVERSFRGA
jgi:hypothetical protein